MQICYLQIMSAALYLQLGGGETFERTAGVRSQRALDTEPGDDLGSRLALSPISCTVMGKTHVYRELLSPHSQARGFDLSYISDPLCLQIQ